MSKKTNITRRTLLKGAVAGAAVMGFPAIVRSAADRKIVIRDPGGPFTKGFGEAFYEPFTKASGITAVGVQGQHEPTGMIKAMVETKNYSWDMSLLSKASHRTSVLAGHLEPIGKPGKNLSQIPENMRTEHLVGIDVYATVMAYRTDTMGQNPPKDWKDLWDLKGHPGRRCLRKHPFDTMEIALMADGVPADVRKLYPIDWERAYKSLDRIKKDVAVWWTGGAQTSQLLKTGEVDVLFTWNGRAQVAVDDNAPVRIVWDQALWTYEGWAILKGTPNAGLCREFIEFCADAERQAVYTKHVAYGPTNPGAYKYVDKERAKVLPTNPEYFKHMVEVDTEFWGKNKDTASERFNAWLLKS